MTLATPAPPVGALRTARDPDQLPPASEVELAVLVDLAARLDLDDPAWAQLAGRARRLTVALAETGDLDAHLVVTSGDPPVVAARVLAAARRTRGPARRVT